MATRFDGRGGGLIAEDSATLPGHWIRSSSTSFTSIFTTGLPAIRAIQQRETWFLDSQWILNRFFFQSTHNHVNSPQIIWRTTFITTEIAQFVKRFFCSLGYCCWDWFCCLDGRPYCGRQKPVYFWVFWHPQAVSVIIIDSIYSPQKPRSVYCNKKVLNDNFCARLNDEVVEWLWNRGNRGLFRFLVPESAMVRPASLSAGTVWPWPSWKGNKCCGPKARPNTFACLRWMGSDDPSCSTFRPVSDVAPVGTLPDPSSATRRDAKYEDWQTQCFPIWFIICDHHRIEKFIGKNYFRDIIALDSCVLQSLSGYSQRKDVADPLHLHQHRFRVWQTVL